MKMSFFANKHTEVIPRSAVAFFLALLIIPAGFPENVFFLPTYPGTLNM